MVAAISGERWWSGTDSNCYAPTYEVGSLPLELPDLQVLLTYLSAHESCEIYFAQTVAREFCAQVFEHRVLAPDAGHIFDLLHGKHIVVRIPDVE